ncbi:MAG: sodium:solute symporter family protein [Candidatus Eremiobacteraeota bacterium]|nr:sodium:solute symporter family protein [Candidatus Eremiobacteraeota bacterium]
MASGTEIFIVLVLGVTILGFFAARWGRADLERFDQWALGGRTFGTVVSWFLLGGDLYTAYTFIAVPALAFGAGAIAFFAVPYTTIAYPFVFAVMARFWTVARRRNYVTTADFVRDRFGSRSLELAVAITGVLATMPYIALQLIGMQAVLTRSGIATSHASGTTMLVGAFVLLGAYTFMSGLRAPALIAFVKDTLIYVTVIAAIAIIPAKLGGWAHVFASADRVLAAMPKPASIIIGPNMYFAYASLALGSALALFIYPHSVTSLLASKSANVVRRNCILLPLYSILLTFLALLGYCALAANLHETNNNFVVPDLFNRYFPNWFTGVAFAAIVIGALVPAAIMAIGASNLFARNILRSFASPFGRPQRDTLLARYTSLVILFGALLIATGVQPKFSINFQLLGGAWILQIFPAVVFGLYTRWFHTRALLLGWLSGMCATVAMAFATNFSSVFLLHFGASLIGGILFYALIVNVLVCLLATVLLRAARVPESTDATRAEDYA